MTRSSALKYVQKLKSIRCGIKGRKVVKFRVFYVHSERGIFTYFLKSVI